MCHLVKKSYTVTFSLSEDMVVRDSGGLTVASAPCDDQQGGYFLHPTSSFTDKQYMNAVTHTHQPLTRALVH